MLLTGTLKMKKSQHESPGQTDHRASSDSSPAQLWTSGVSTWPEFLPSRHKCDVQVQPKLRKRIQHLCSVSQKWKCKRLGKSSVATWATFNHEAGMESREGKEQKQRNGQLMEGARRAVAERELNEPVAEGRRTDSACRWGRPVPRVEGMLPEDLCFVFVRPGWLMGHLPHQTRLWELLRADTRAPHHPVQIRTFKREEFDTCSGWEPQASGIWVRPKRKPRPRRIRAQEEQNCLCLMQSGHSLPRWRPLCSKDGREPRGHVHRQQGKHTSDRKPH